MADDPMGALHNNDLIVDLVLEACRHPLVPSLGEVLRNPRERTLCSTEDLGEGQCSSFSEKSLPVGKSKLDPSYEATPGHADADDLLISAIGEIDPSIDTIRRNETAAMSVRPPRRRPHDFCCLTYFLGTGTI
jgi:hypothetical protein